MTLKDISTKAQKRKHNPPSLSFFLGYGDAGWLPIENLEDEYKDLENTIIGKLPQKAYHKPGHPIRFEIMYSKEFIFLGFYNDGPI